jgi:hypothetical protein
MTSRLDFGMISSVGMWPLRKHFKIYLVLPMQRMPLLRLTWSFLVVPITRMLALLELMIRRWMSSSLSLGCCI